MFLRSQSKMNTRKSDLSETLEEVKYKIEKAKDEVEKSKRELDSLKQDFKLFDNRSLYKEDRLRDHITNTSVLVHDKSVEAKVAQLEDLYNQVLTNISNITNDIEQEIFNKKSDLDKRVDYRIMDAEYRYRNRLDEKVREQEEMARLLHAITQDMTKIKDNYNKIRKRIENHLGTKTEYQLNIREEKNRHELLLLELKKYKILLQKEKEKANKVSSRSRPETVLFKSSTGGNNMTIDSNDNTSNKAVNTLKILHGNKRHIEQKYKRLQGSFNEITLGRSNFEKRIYEIINNKARADSSIQNYDTNNTRFYTDEDRNRIIEAITHDNEILSYYYNENFKTIHVSNIILDNQK
jgi:chromosome segregation ATPase